MQFLLKILLVGFISLALAATQCHNSCNCAIDSNICDSCKSPYGDPNQLFFFGNRYCPCKFGYYASQVSPLFICSPVTSGDNIDRCEMQIVGETLQTTVDTNCKLVKDGNKNLVQSLINLDRNGQIKFSGCLYEFTAVFYYKDPTKPGNALTPLNNIIHTIGADMTLHKLLFPLGDLNKYSTKSGIDPKDSDKFWNLIEIVIEMGHQRKKVRAHTFQIYVYTERNQVQIFRIDVKPLETEGCQSGQECIIIADLDTQSRVYTDSTYSVVKKDPLNYQVGDIFYAIIKFTDPTYSKNLLFNQLYYKTDDNKIFNFNSIVSSSPFAGGLKIAFPLIYPTTHAIIQVDMLISNLGLRNLFDTSPSSINTQFKLTTTSRYSNTNSVASSFVLCQTLSFLAFLSLLFLM